MSSPSGSPRPGGAGPQAARTVSLVTLGCARNEVDSEELAARLAASGWELAETGEASVVVVNTCGFIQAAKQESIAELLAAAESGAKVAAVGCLAERYGAELADELPEAQILSFDDYGEIGSRLDDVLAGRRRPAHTARDRRALLPITPAERQAPRAKAPAPRRRRQPSLRRRGSARTRPAGVPPPAVQRGGGAAEDRVRLRPALHVLCDPVLPRRVHVPAAAEILAEARWLASQGVRELLLVSENSTSYGKDLGEPAAARGAAAGPGRDRRHRAGQDQLSAARRAAARA